MCLFIDKSDFQIKIAEKDIICYKAIQTFDQLNMSERNLVIAKYSDVCNDLNKLYFSPYRFQIVTFNTVLTAKGFFQFDCEPRVDPVYNKIVIESGAFHSYVHKFKADNTILNGLWDRYVAKCIIPKGSKYILGYSYGYVPNYASQQIIYKEICS